MSSSGMLRHVILVRTDVSEECITSIIRATRTGKLGMLVVTSNCHDILFHCGVLRLLVTPNIVPGSLILVSLMMEAICSSKTLVLTRATWCNILEDNILHSHRCENLISYKEFCVYYLLCVFIIICNVFWVVW
jgi:hypothetical protein